LYFSAKDEQEKIDEEIEEVSDNIKNLHKEYMNTPKIINRSNLMEIVKQLVIQWKENQPNYIPKDKDVIINEEDEVKKEDIVTIGMCGFPNVGKSSVINVLCKQKLVGVDARPGKTKNYQTIFLEKELLLCDCPGLVFPTIASSKSEMICNGVLPVDNLKDWISPIEYVTKKIPKTVMNYVYKLNLVTEKVDQAFVTANHL